jgi:hypothetical protein
MALEWAPALDGPIVIEASVAPDACPTTVDL